MRGFGGITDTLNSLLGSAGITLQPWAFPLLLVGVFAALVPHIRQNQRTQKAREAIRKAVEDGGAGTVSFQDKVLALAHGHPTTLLVITSEAQKRGLNGLANRALLLLEHTGKHRSDTRRLKQTMKGPPPVHPEAENAAIEKLMEQGLVTMAKDRLARAKAHWPNNTDWGKWDSRFDSEE